jgi:hypothetical protein
MSLSAADKALCWVATASATTTGLNRQQLASKERSKRFAVSGVCRGMDKTPVSAVSIAINVQGESLRHITGVKYFACVMLTTI